MNGERAKALQAAIDASQRVRKDMKDMKKAMETGDDRCLSETDNLKPASIEPRNR